MNLVHNFIFSIIGFVFFFFFIIILICVFLYHYAILLAVGS